MACVHGPTLENVQVQGQTGKGTVHPDSCTHDNVGKYKDVKELVTLSKFFFLPLKRDVKEPAPETRAHRGHGRVSRPV